MMIRSSQIPPLLHRITGNGIKSAMLVTGDGELLGTSHSRHAEHHEDQATLITDVILDYNRLGTELHQLKLPYVEIELSHATIGVASAGSSDCLVIALADDTVASGLLKSRVLACASHVHDSFMPMSDASS